MKLAAYCFFSLWNLNIDFSPHETDLVDGTCCMLIFCSWYLLRADFCSWNLLHVFFSFRDTYKMIFLLMKLILIMEFVVC